MEPSGSPIPSSNQWESQVQLVGAALSKLQKIEELVQFCNNIPSIKSLKEDLESLGNFFRLLMNTKNIVSSPSLGYFCILPSEIILHIFKALNYREVLRMACVCRAFKDTSEDETIWHGLCSQLNLLTAGEPLPKSKNHYWLLKSRLRVFKDNESKSGVGMYIWPCKVTAPGVNKHENRYCGDWVDNLREGYGTYHWCNGSLYAGEWKADKREGFGTRSWPNGNKYIGEYKNHKRHGKGEFTFSNTSVFSGTFEDNKFVHGTYTWPNGRIYNGDWNNIFRHGNGMYWWPDGRSYQGEWKNDKRHGHGVYRWPDGDTFDGMFNEGKRWGKGALKRANGESFPQSWREEKFEEFNKGIVVEDGEVVVTAVATAAEVDLTEEESQDNSNAPAASSNSNSNNKKRSHNDSDDDYDQGSESHKLPKLSED